jgi:hypothetical protein
MWVCSIYLEALAIVPQLIILQRYREVENLTGHYVFLLGIYRGLYILNWVYRSYHEAFYEHNWVVYICGFVQTALYLDFFYYYFLRLVITSAENINSCIIILLGRSMGPYNILFASIVHIQSCMRYFISCA